MIELHNLKKKRKSNNNKYNILIMICFARTAVQLIESKNTGRSNN